MLEGTVEESVWTRWRHRLRLALTPSRRGTTALEADLSARLDDRDTELKVAARRIAELQTDVTRLESSLMIANLEVVKLSQVCQRDLERVKAESATFIRKGVEATT